MDTATERNAAAFDAIMQGLEEAIAYQRGELVTGIRVHRPERLPDGTAHRVMETSHDQN